MKTDKIAILQEKITSTVAGGMIAMLNGELSSLYPEEGANHFRLDEQEVAKGRGAFLMAYRHGKPVGCGAIRRIDGDTAEIKRMYVEQVFTRGQGIARAVLGALEAEARRLGVARLGVEPTDEVFKRLVAD